MTKDVTVQEMQEHFEEHLAEVKQGVTLRLMEGAEAVAEVGPASVIDDDDPLKDLIWREAKGRFCDFVPPPPMDPPVDVMALLREDRDAR